MDFELSEDQSLVLESVKKLALELKKTTAEREARAQLDEATQRALQELGLYGLTAPVEAGGSGLPLTTGCLVIEALARHDPAVAWGLAVHLYGATPLFLAAGAPLDPLLEAPATLALFEADRLHPERVTTRAEAIGANFQLHGHKPWVTVGAQNAPVWVLAMAPDGLSIFRVEAEAPGLARRPIPTPLGLRGAGFVHLDLEGAPAQRVGQALGGGLGPHLEHYRLGMAAVAVGLGRASLEEARAYALDRRQFNQPIADFQAIQWMLADLATENDGARLLTLSAAGRVESGASNEGRAARAKVRAVEAAIQAAMKAIQIFGGNGYVREYPVERQLRDATTLAGLPPAREPDRTAVFQGLFHESA